MPLFKSKSKPAFEHNFKAEMSAGKPKDQSLAIAYSVKRKAAAKKHKASGGAVQSGSRDMNMADGGMVNAKNQKRPMPNDLHDDAKMAHQNSGNKRPGQDSMTDNPTVKQAQANSSRKVLPIKRPNIVQGSNFKVRTHDQMQDELHEQESNLQDSEAVASPDTQPDDMYDESGPNRQGRKVPDMADEHSTRKGAYRKASEDQYSEDEAESDMEQSYAKGGEVEASDYDASPNKYEDDLQDLDPSMDEASSMADSHNEMGPDRQGDPIPDMEEPHNEYQDSAYASGGAVESGSYDMDMAEGGSVDEERDIMEAASLAASIMSKRKMMARGGAILSEDSMESDDSDQADLSRNAEEDANMEDKASFDALRKENYSESPALREANNPEDSAQSGHPSEDDHDRSLVAAIRRKMRVKSPITR